MLVGLAVSIALHELGHLLPAKRFGVRVGQYMIGFGPTIWSRRKGETEYGVKAIPLGGYISMAGMYPPSPKEAARAGRAGGGFFATMVQDARTANDETLHGDDDTRVFYRLPVYKRIIVMLGGPVMNLVLGIVMFTIALSGIGIQTVTTALKAMALARQIRATLPHIDVTCHVSTVEELLLHPDDPFAKVDLIVSVLGDWPAESLLDEWQVSHDDPVPIVYGWTEPHAAAGHAIVISSGEDRLRSGLDAYGTPNVIAVRWTDDTRRYEPACGAAFDPYGPVELGFVTSMISQAALDVIQGNVSSGTHRIWLARRRFVEAAGGLWSDEIRAIAPQALEGATIIERKWGRDTRNLAA